MPIDFIELLEPTPKLTTKKCKIVSFALWLLLKSTAPLVALLSWYFFDIYLAFFGFLFGIIIAAIFRSKMHNSAIPPRQREYNYTDKAICDWFSAQELCFENRQEENSHAV